MLYFLINRNYFGVPFSAKSQSALKASIQPKVFSYALKMIFEKRCFWCLAKLVIASMALFNISLLVLDLQSDSGQNAFETIVRYVVLLILNSKMFCDVLLKSHGYEKIVCIWSCYCWICLWVNTVMIAFSQRAIFYMPVISRTAANYVVDHFELDYQSKVPIGYLICFFIVTIVITFLLISADCEEPAPVGNPPLSAINMRQAMAARSLPRNPPPRYTSRERLPVLPNCSTNLHHTIAMA